MPTKPKEQTSSFQAHSLEAASFSGLRKSSWDRNRDLLPKFGPGTMRDEARLLKPALPGRQSPAGPHSKICGVALCGMELGSIRGQGLHIVLWLQGGKNA